MAAWGQAVPVTSLYRPLGDAMATWGEQLLSRVLGSGVRLQPFDGHLVFLVRKAICWCSWLACRGQSHWLIGSLRVGSRCSGLGWEQLPLRCWQKSRAKSEMEGVTRLLAKDPRCQMTTGKLYKEQSKGAHLCVPFKMCTALNSLHTLS